MNPTSAPLLELLDTDPPPRPAAQGSSSPKRWRSTSLEPVCDAGDQHCWTLTPAESLLQTSSLNRFHLWNPRTSSPPLIYLPFLSLLPSAVTHLIFLFTCSSSSLLSLRLLPSHYILFFFSFFNSSLISSLLVPFFSVLFEKFSLLHNFSFPLVFSFTSLSSPFSLDILY